MFSNLSVPDYGKGVEIWLLIWILLQKVSKQVSGCRLNKSGIISLLKNGISYTLFCWNK